METIFGEDEINNPEKWETKRGKEQYRIIIYCKDQEQKEFIQNLLHNKKTSDDRKTGDVLERLLR